MNKNSRILIAGSETLAGRALSSCLESKNFHPLKIATEQLIDLHWTLQMFEKEKPEFVFLVAGKSGGIQANQKYPATLMRSNLLAELQVLEAARLQKVWKLFYLASSCVYPKNAPQPMKPSDLLTSILEPTSQAYSLAKLSGIELCRAYRQEFRLPCVSAIVSDPFGPESSFDAEHSHVIAALIVKIHRAKTESSPSLALWGSGTPVRDFIFSADLAEGCLFLMQNYDEAAPINLTAGRPVAIRDLAVKLKEIIGYRGEIIFDAQFPDGTPVKTLDASKITELGWKPRFSFEEALRRTYDAYLQKEPGEIIHA